MSFEQRSKGVKRLSEGTVFQAEETASAKAVRQGCAWYIWGTRRPMKLKVREQGESYRRCGWRGKRKVKRWQII